MSSHGAVPHGVAPNGAVPNGAVHVLLSKSADGLEDCRKHLQEGDCLVLVNTAVLWLLEPGWEQALPAGIHTCVVDADLDAHGMSALPLPGHFERISDMGWVELVMSYAHCLSWK
jgi:sulfur relay protein TusB/DsrH